MMPGRPKPRDMPIQERRKTERFEGILIALITSKRCAASSIPLQEDVTMMTGMKRARRYSDCSVSRFSSAGTAGSMPASSGTSRMKSRSAAQLIAACAATAVQKMRGILPVSFLPRHSDTCFVTARPSPRSKMLKYQSRTHRRDRIPNLAFPSPAMMGGMAITPTASGTTSPRRFSTVLRARRDRLPGVFALPGMLTPPLPVSPGSRCPAGPPRGRRSVRPS